MVSLRLEMGWRMMDGCNIKFSRGSIESNRRALLFIGRTGKVKSTMFLAILLLLLLSLRFHLPGKCPSVCIECQYHTACHWTNLIHRVSHRRPTWWALKFNQTNHSRVRNRIHNKWLTLYADCSRSTCICRFIISILDDSRLILQEPDLKLIVFVWQIEMTWTILENYFSIRSCAIENVVDILRSTRVHHQVIPVCKSCRSSKIHIW